MEALILVVHVLVAVAIIALVLLQQGKGADAGASFGGGASQTVFGSQGGSSFFGRMTGVFAVVFFVTSFALAFVASEKAKSVSGVLDFVPQAPVVEAGDALPQLDEVEESSDVPSN
ncbi:preprotein translocase subunit SecG [Marinomonas balearica]|uniref:Protein-export membrane protein SecG n=1 Tax=Marinomonas balearica TaxID=491947 RepID=A0A4R6M9G9_9GAMM|nr:preprotein translocase subunit SecG [Marinomonas balearica]TDO98151.1 protein translocase subunit secG [Marinomonas balearica]